jgi:lysophospholipase L1-like esterase
LAVRHLRVGTAVAAAALLLSGCTSPGRSASAPSSSPSLPAVQRYVALGDSFSAGPLIPTSDLAGGCLRSDHNYPSLVAQRLDVPRFVDVTCSGATTRDLTHRQRTFGDARIPAQLHSVTRATDLVTLGIGGNDFSIFSSLVSCGPGGDACSPALQRRLLRDAERVESRVARVVGRVVDRAPDAEVYVVGYPQVLPADDGCRAVPLPADRLEAAATVAKRLNDSLRTGAESAGASFVDVEEASEGHDVCAGKDAWVNGPQAQPGVAAPFHPFLAGMRGVAQEVFTSVTGDDAPETETASPPRAAIVRNEVPKG